MHIRPHFDYCDIIYHKPASRNDFTSSLSLNYLMNTLEKTQYQAALAITGTWKGTNTDKLYEELGWESLHHRRIYRRLITIYKIIKGYSPHYLLTPITLRENTYLLRGSQRLTDIRCRKDRFRNSFYPNAIHLWNELDANLKNAVSLSIFKSSLVKLIKPDKKETYNILDPLGLKWLFQLRVGLSHLKTHKKRHNFSDTTDDICDCSISTESTKHFLLECPLHTDARIILMNTMTPLLNSHGLENINNTNLTHLLLYGHKLFNLFENQLTLRSVITFIKSSNHFPT